MNDQDLTKTDYDPDRSLVLIESLSHFLTNFLQNLASCQTSLRNVSAQREDGLLKFLNSSEFVYAHSTCRQKYIHNKYIQIYKNKGNTASVPSAYSPSKKRLRNILSTDFNWKDNCFIYGKEDDGMKGTKFKKNLE
jgi:hypothetical protein